MRRVFIVIVLIVAAAILGMWRSSGGVRQGLSRAVGMSSDEQQGEARQEIRKSFQLQPGARVEVQGINGAVEIQTSDTKTAEVYVLRTAKSQSSLNRREVIVEETPTGLIVKSRQSHSAGFWAHLFGSNPTEQVTIKAPREIALSLRGINGKVTSGDIIGSVEVKGVNGRVELGQTTESAEIGGVNGNIVVGLDNLGERGARLSGVNGNIELRLGGGLNADLIAKGMNGNVRSEIPEVIVDREEHGSRFSAHIGSGGSLITISGINGNVRLARPANVPGSAANEKGTKAAQHVEKEAPKENKSEN